MRAPVRKLISLVSLSTLLSLPGLAEADPPQGDNLPVGAGALPTPRVLSVWSTSETPRIDGALDEAFWTQATPADPFVQLSPKEGSTPLFASHVRVARDASHLYVAARLEDPDPSAIVRQLARRDTDTQADWFEVAVDGYHNRRTAQVFRVNAAGVQRDVLLYDDVQEDARWDAVWQSAVRIDDGGWSVELAIPLTQLRFDPDAERWGLQLTRFVHREQELSAWQRIPLNQGVKVSRFGDAALPSKPEPPANLELRPYVASGASLYRGEPGNPFQTGRDWLFNAGADLKYTVANSWYLNATVNPDFGQVEADPAQVNLTDQQLFYPEQRPFFLEGGDLFAPAAGAGVGGGVWNGPPNLFYSRRIGAAPTTFVERPLLPGDEEPYVGRPDDTPIYGALKLTGRSGGGFSLGVLDAVTAPVFERYADLDGRLLEERRRIQPLSHYLVARGQQEFGGGTSTLGVLGTMANRELDPRLRGQLPGNAYSGGLDWNVRVGDGSYFVAGRLVGSRVDGTPEVMRRLQTNFTRYAQRPDATHLEVDEDATSLQGLSGQLRFGKVRSNLTWNVGAHATTPFFEVNDLGFQNRADELALTGQISWQDRNPGKVLRQWTFTSNAAAISNFGFDLQQPRVSFNWNALTTGFTPLNAFFVAYLPGQDDRLLRGGPSAEAPLLDVGFQANVGTDVRKKLRANFYGNAGGSTSGGQDWILGANVTAQPISALTLTLAPQVYLNVRDTQYVRAYADPTATETYGTRYLVSELTNIVSFVEARAEWTFSPKLSLQTYARANVTSGAYDRFRFFAQPRTRSFVDPVSAPTLNDGQFEVQAPGAAAAFRFRDPNFLYSSLQANAVARWEYLPGSTLFFVYQLSCDAPRTTDGRFDPGAYLKPCGDSMPSHTVMAKLTYWFST